MIQVKDKYFVELLSNNTLQERIQSLAAELMNDYKDKDPLLIGVLNGSFMFLSDLFKALHIDCEVSFIRVSSYSQTASTGEVKKILGLKESIENRHILIVEDIVDSGLTLSQVKEQLLEHNPASLKIVTLLNKPDAMKVNLPLDYIGFKIENKFVVGYGLDYDEKGRNLDAIYVLKEEELA